MSSLKPVRVYFITEVVEGGKPYATYHNHKNINKVFDEMVADLGYERDGNHAYDVDDANHNNITLNHIDVPICDVA
jgi:hypothetical protein